MQAAKMRGLAQEAHGEQTKGQKTYGEICPRLNTLHEGATTASNGV